MRTFAEFMLISEGMTMKDFKQQRSRQKQKEKRAADKIAPNRRKDIHTDRYSPERAARHRANVDPDFDYGPAADERNYPGGKLKNPKKIRKAKALGELGEGLDKKFGSMRKRGGRSAPPEERSVGGEMNRKNKDYWADMGGPDRDRGKGSKAKRRSAELGEAYDKDVMQSSQIRRTGEGGRIGAERKKSTPERRRVKAVGGGKTEPVEYKPRKDIGQQRQASARTQQPEQERGSARERQLAAAKEERRKAAQARAAAKKSGGTAPAAAKPSAKEASKEASKLLSKKKPKAAPAAGYTPPKASGLSTKERLKVTRAGEKMLRGIMKDQETAKYKKATGENPKGKAKTKILGYVEKRMAN